MSPNFNELFSYLKKNKDKYDINIISAGNKYYISNILQHKNLLSLFNNIYADNREENKDNLIKISNVGFLDYICCIIK